MAGFKGGISAFGSVEALAREDRFLSLIFDEIMSPQ